jgi:hypothetical protein
MSNIYDSTNNIFTFFGILIGLIVVARCLYIFVYPLFCYNPRKISITESNEQLDSIESIESVENTNSVFVSDITAQIKNNIDIKNVPIADAEYTDIEEGHGILYNVPIATIV